VDDIKTPPDKREDCSRAKEKVYEVQSQYAQGLLTDQERYTKIIEILGQMANE